MPLRDLAVFFATFAFLPFGDAANDTGAGGSRRSTRARVRRAATQREATRFLMRAVPV